MAAALALATSLVLSPAASAADGTYTVSACKLPDGSPAPTDGFQPTNSQRFLVLENACPSGGVLRAAVTSGELQPPSAFAAWRWTVAPGTTLRSVRVWRSISVVWGDFSYGAEAIASPDLVFDSANLKEVCSAFQQCGPTLGRADAWNDPSNLWSFDLGRTSGISFAAFCNGLTACPARTDGLPTAEIRVHRFEATVTDDSRPVVTLVSGSFQQATKLKGTSDVRLQVADQGSGLYHVLTQYLDDASSWRTVQSQPADAKSANCRDVVPGNSDAYEFAYRQPCPLALDSAYPLDTSAVPNGQRTVRVAIEDAGGNLTEAARVSALVANGRGIINGAGATDQAALRVAWYRGIHKLRGDTRRLRFASSGLLRGRLLNSSGAPIAGAEVSVQGQPDRNEAVGRQVAVITTDGHGTFAWQVPKRQESMRLSLQYRAYSEDEAPAADRELRTLVRPSVSLHVRTDGINVSYSGRLGSGPIPRGGKIIVLQGRVRGARQWATFATKRAGTRTGWFGGGYRLRAFVPGVSLQFRVVVPRDGSYGYATGHSTTVTRRLR